jgi:glucan 1,3-beta-glucosidase
LPRWITPSIFESVDQSLGIVDEYTLCANDEANAPQILGSHWDNWVSQDDFQRIASVGMNMVRIPIGYWAFDNSNSPYVKGAADYLDKAIGWARSTSPPLKVIIDLHGAPGSQNGFDNSGKRGPVNFLDGGVGGASAQQTIEVLAQISDKYAALAYQDVVVGIELLNEPMGTTLNNGDLRDFFSAGAGKVQAVSDTPVVIQDSFLAPSSWNGFLTGNSAMGTLLAISRR